eukprot:1192485-Prorocentrum_minimum.AAC.1
MTDGAAARDEGDVQSGGSVGVPHGTFQAAAPHAGESTPPSLESTPPSHPLLEREQALHERRSSSGSRRCTSTDCDCVVLAAGAGAARVLRQQNRVEHKPPVVVPHFHREMVSCSGRRPEKHQQGWIQDLEGVFKTGTGEFKAGRGGFKGRLTEKHQQVRVWEGWIRGWEGWIQDGEEWIQGWEGWIQGCECEYHTGSKVES